MESQLTIPHIESIVEYVVFTIPTELQITLYQKILQTRIVSNVLHGQAQGGHQLALMTVLQKLCNSPGLLSMSAAKVSLSVPLRLAYFHSLSRDQPQGTGIDILTPEVLKCMPSNLDPNDFALSGQFASLPLL